MTARIVPLAPSAVQGHVQEMLIAVKAKFGKVPNAIQTMAISPATLEGYLGLSGALSKGALPPVLREQIALAVSQVNGCEYCLSAHSLTGKMAGLKPDQVLAARQGKAEDPKAQAALTLALNTLERRGQISDEQLVAARNAGLSDAEILEVVANIAVMMFTNFLNNVAQADVDFPKVAVAL